VKYLLRVRKEKVEIEATVGVIQGNNLGTILYIYILYIYIYLIQAVTTTLDKHREKIQVWLRNKKYLVILYNYGIKKTFEKKSVTKK
jgi:hypothetical protein